MSTPAITSNLEYLILDSNAFIRGQVFDLFNKAQRIVTVAEVISEVRDSKARELLEKLPFNLEIMNPSPASCQAVADFSTKTGDFRSLSKTDIKVIALSHMLEKQVNPSYVVPEHKSLITKLPTTVSQKVAPSVSTSTVTSVDGISSLVQDVETSLTLSESPSQATSTEPASSSEPIDGDVATPSEPTEQPTVVMVEGTDAEDDDEEDESDDDDDDDESDDDEEEEYHIRFADEREEVYHHQCSLEELQAEDAFPSLASATTATDDANSGSESTGVVKPATSSWASLAKKPQGNGGTTVVTVTKTSKPTVSQPAVVTHTIPSTTPIAATVSTAAAATAPATSSSSVFVTEAKGRAILSNNQGNTDNETKFLREQDDGTGWINSSNMFTVDPFIVVSSSSSNAAVTTVVDGTTVVNKKKKSKSKANKKSSSVPVVVKPPAKVACFTTDFSMQNVMLQMQLHIISADGMVVQTARQWVLRCMACYTIHTKDLSRLFCSRCGAHHLSRVAASVDEGGELKLHLRKHYQVNTSGMQYSLPAPGKQNRFSGELLLREDQLLSGIWRQKVVKINKDIKSAFGDDVTSDVGLHMNKQEHITVGWGKGNPNARRGRERRGKKKQ